MSLFPKHSQLWAFALIMLMIVGLSSCKVFRKKNRCNTCPTWDEIQLEAQDKSPQAIVVEDVEG